MTRAFRVCNEGVIGTDTPPPFCMQLNDIPRVDAAQLSRGFPRRTDSGTWPLRCEAHRGPSGRLSALTPTTQVVCAPEGLISLEPLYICFILSNQVTLLI